jgi:rubrerythrin
MPQGQVGSQSMPLPPLVPQRPPMPMNRPADVPEETPVTPSTEKTDAEMVLSILTALEEKMQTMDEKVEQMKVDDKKHYDSLRRGLKRLKDNKPEDKTDPTLAGQDPAILANGANGVYPCCICNYCLKRTPLF